MTANMWPVFTMDFLACIYNGEFLNYKGLRLEMDFDYKGLRLKMAITITQINN